VTEQRDNPLQQPPPDDPIQRIHALARDLAYGAIRGMWGVSTIVTPEGQGEDWLAKESITEEGQLRSYLTNKWNRVHPLSTYLLSFGYFAILERQQYSTVYLLTEKAFALLDQPATPPSVFISYKQVQSSALGLLVESRIKHANSNANVFIDKLLEPGDKWEERLEETVRQSRYFIYLLGPNTLESETVRKEIQWARESDCILIPICHGGYTPDNQYKDLFNDVQAIIISPESAEEYELAMIKLLNTLGYSTL
jgi:hypothetical protein